MENNIIKVGLLEYSNRMLVHEKIELDVTKYPELEGMDEDQILAYIKENAHKMNPTDETGWADSLYDELMEMDIVRDKEYDYSTDIYND
jgi:hypothetical protein